MCHQQGAAVQPLHSYEAFSYFQSLSAKWGTSAKESSATLSTPTTYQTRAFPERFLDNKIEMWVMWVKILMLVLIKLAQIKWLPVYVLVLTNNQSQTRVYRVINSHVVSRLSLSCLVKWLKENTARCACLWHGHSVVLCSWCGSSFPSINGALCTWQTSP